MTLLVFFFCFVGNHRCGEGLLLLVHLLLLTIGKLGVSAVLEFTFLLHLGDFCDWTVCENGFLLFTVIKSFRLGSNVLGVYFFNLLQ
jgi:hypothetical protein